jgi:hypothetical protein
MDKAKLLPLFQKKNPNPRLRTEILILDLEVALVVADEDVHDVDRSRPALAGLI